jgi:hypothetical protein
MDQEKTSPKDVFLHLLAILTLYVSAVSFLTLLFQYINLYLPDPLEQNLYYVQGIYSSMRWALAMLVIVFPVYLGTSWYLGKSYAVTPLKRNLRIRKWLIYFTLFLTALVIIGDLVALVYSLLQGEITLRFILKIISVLFVAGSVFTYYLWDVRQHATE